MRNYIMFEDLFEDGTLREYIENNTNDPWVGTVWERYVFMSPKQKGEFGERLVDKFLTNKGHGVLRASTSTAGHDRVVDDTLTEIKFSLAQRNKGDVADDMFMINHVSIGKDWERLVFFGINKYDEPRLVFFTKEDFIKNREEFFKNQQGGKKIKNDDYICSGKKVKELIDQDWVKDISEW